MQLKPFTLKEIRVLTAIFSNRLPSKEIASFRGAVIEKVGIENDLFHNHNNTGEGSNYYYRYPLVQYQLRRHKPSLVFLEEAVDKANLFLSQPNIELTVRGTPYRAQLKSLSIDRHKIGNSPQFQYYQINNWIALNEKNFGKYQQLYSLSKCATLLEEVLVGHILALAKGLGHRFSTRFEVEIGGIEKESVAIYNQIKVKTFDIQFRTNLVLPTGIGLGKGASRGFGLLNPHYNRKLT